MDKGLTLGNLLSPHMRAHFPERCRLQTKEKESSTLYPPIPKCKRERLRLPNGLDLRGKNRKGNRVRVGGAMMNVVTSPTYLRRKRTIREKRRGRSEKHSGHRTCGSAPAAGARLMIKGGEKIEIKREVRETLEKE